MKKLLLRTAAAMMIAALILIGCSAATQKPAEAARPRMLQIFNKMPDKQLADKFRYYELFTNPRNLHANVCMSLYFDLIYDSGYGEDYFKKWSSKKDWSNKRNRKCRIPVTDVKRVLNSYLDNVQFNPADIDYYNPKTKCVDCFLNFFENKATIKVRKKQILPGGRMRITCFYSEQFNGLDQPTVSFTLKFSDTGYRYLSAIKD